MTWKSALVIGGLGIIMLVLSVYLSRGARRVSDIGPVDLDALRTDVVAALDRDDLTEAVKIYRQRTNARLLDAADAVQRIDRERR